MRLDNIDECIPHLPIERLQVWVNGLRSEIMIELAIRFVKSDGGPRPRMRSGVEPRSDNPPIETCNCILLN
jgi:hypothetical protein